MSETEARSAAKNGQQGKAAAASHPDSGTSSFARFVRLQLIHFLVSLVQSNRIMGVKRKLQVDLQRVFLNVVFFYMSPASDFFFFFCAVVSAAR